MIGHLKAAGSFLAQKLVEKLATDVESDDVELSDMDVDPPKMSHAMKAAASTRDFILDASLPDPQEVFTLMGLPPISDEVLEMEQKASVDRVAEMCVLSPVLEAYAMAIASAMSASLANSMGQHQTSDLVMATRWALFNQVLENAVFSGLVGGISQMVHHGLISLDPTLQAEIVWD